MASGPLSPVMLIATSGLLQNQGISANTNLSNSINQYESFPTVVLYQDVVNVANASVGNGISSSTFQNILDLGNIIPAINDSFDSGYASELDNSTSLVGYLTSWNDQLLGNGDLTKFAQIYGACRSYQATTNQFISSSKNTGAASATFVDMDAVTTGGISLISKNIPKFAQDLKSQGNLIDPADITNLGFPSALLRQVLNSGGIVPSVKTTLEINGITNDILVQVADSAVPLSANVERDIYQAMTLVTESDLEQVLFLLDVTVSGLKNMADLLDPSKIFVNSLLDLTLLVGTNKISIYIDPLTVNSLLQPEFDAEDSYILLRKIIPQGQALANRALSRSFFQIKNLINLSLPDIANSALAVESNQGLGDITTLATPVPPAVVSSIESSLAPNLSIDSTSFPSATGPKGQFTFYDFMGTAAGYPNVVSQAVSTIGNLQQQGAFDDLIADPEGAYVVMIDTLNGIYGNVTGNISGLPAPYNSGEPYSNADVAFNVSFIPTATGILNNILTVYAQEIETLDLSWVSLEQQLVREKTNVASAEVDFGNLAANSKPALMSLATNLHEIATQTENQGPAEFFESVADISTEAGQAIVASLREGRNIKALEDAGIGIDTNLPTG
jgi:hypothetical protein